MRLATGVDAMTGNLFDFDRRGDGKQKQLRPSQDPMKTPCIRRYNN